MDTSSQVVTLKAEAVSKRQRRSIAEKRCIVEETLAEGASVVRVARAHGVNANQVFYWRKLYQAGRLGASDAAQLLPVRVAAESTRAKISRKESSSTPICSQSSGMIHIELRQAQVRIEGELDPVLVRTLLECLR